MPASCAIKYSIPSKSLIGLRITFEKRLASIGAENSAAKRRELALALAPVLKDFQATYLSVGRELHVADDNVLGCRADLIFDEMLSEVADTADWPRHGDSGFDIAMITAMDGEEAA